MGVQRENHPSVFHLAAHFANQNSVDNPETDLMVNGMGILRFLNTLILSEWNVLSTRLRVVEYMVQIQRFRSKKKTCAINFTRLTKLPKCLVNSTPTASHWPLRPTN